MPMFATSDGTKLYYEDTGKGPALVFCHGLNSSHLAIRPFIDQFRGQYRCICYDQRGHACSDTPRVHMNVKTLGRDLRELLDHLGVEKAFAIGHSMGAATLLSYVDQFGCDRFEKLVIVDMTPCMRNADWSGGLGSGRWTDEEFMRDMDAFFDDLGAGLWRITKELMVPALASTPAHLVPSMEKACAAGLDPWTMASLWFSLYRTDLRGAVPKIGVPVQFIQPEIPNYAGETVEFYRKNLRGPFRVETGFHGTTHLILQERPLDVAARVKPFLRGEV